MAKTGEGLWLHVLRCTSSEVQADSISVVAVGVAFWVALALFPGVALLVWVANQLAGPDEARWLVHAHSRAAIESARELPGVLDLEVESPSLEDIYVGYMRQRRPVAPAPYAIGVA